jgi:hypothetical protein
MGAGVMAGFGLWGSMFPIDTIKSKIQADSLSKPQFNGTIDCLKRSLAVEVSWSYWQLACWNFSATSVLACCLVSSPAACAVGCHAVLYASWTSHQRSVLQAKPADDLPDLDTTHNTSHSPCFCCLSRLRSLLLCCRALLACGAV